MTNPTVRLVVQVALRDAAAPPLAWPASRKIMGIDELTARHAKLG
jgi:hypothetical protein